MFDEEYIYLAGLTDTTALIAWGKFFFDDSGKVLDRGATETIGENSYVFANPFAEISVRDAATDEALPPVLAFGANHCLVRGLRPDTEYRYSIKVKEGENWRVWGTNQHRIYDVENGIMRPPMPSEHRAYNNRFRTFPDTNTSAPLQFLVLGDFGKADSTQMKVGEAMKRFVNSNSNSARFIITTGDNIYSHGTGAGNRDDDWFDSFFQPYRYIINQIPVFPSMGNHDTSEQSEFNQGFEERKQVYENFYVGTRFAAEDSPVRLDWRSDSGLFYRFRFGKDVLLVCADTSKEQNRIINGTSFSGRLTEYDANSEFISRCFDESLQNNIKWCIPFGHHPPYSRGKSHGDTIELKPLINGIRSRGLRVFFCGHDHNFQYLTKDGTKLAGSQDNNSASEQNKIHYLLTGGGSEPRQTRPDKSTKATLRAWGGTDRGHFLAVNINGNEMTISPIDESGAMLPMKDRANADQVWNNSINIRI